jgi:hypothetical protein
METNPEVNVVLDEAYFGVSSTRRAMTSLHARLGPYWMVIGRKLPATCLAPK